MISSKFRMAECLLLSVLLFIACAVLTQESPSSPLAITVYKLHLMSLAGWGGYWLDRWLFPYARPHQALRDAEDVLTHGAPSQRLDVGELFISAEWSMIRRAVIVFGCLVCVGLGA